MKLTPRKDFLTLGPRVVVYARVTMEREFHANEKLVFLTMLNLQLK